MTRRYALAACALVFALSASSAKARPDRNLIVFMRDEINVANGDVVIGGKLWIMDSDGGGLRQITFGRSYDDHPSLYPDGKAVLFTRFPVNNRLQYRRIYKDGRPYWTRKDGAGAPVLDSDRLPVERAADAPLMRLDLRTGQQTVVLHIRGCQLHHANISPADGRISYQADCDGQSRRWIGLPPAGKAIEAVATNGVALRDGAIFQSEPDKARASRERDVTIVRLRRSGATETYDTLVNTGRNRRPAPSPLGDIFAWQSNRGGAEDDIWVANLDGSAARNVTATRGNDGHPWFTRDGKTIVFESDRTGEWEIWKIDLANGRQTQLTFGGGRYSSTRARPASP